MIPLIAREFPGYDFCFTQTHSGQGIGVLDNTQLNLNKVTVQYAIERNCEKLLSYHLQIRFYALDHNELLLAKMGLVLLLISCPWVIIKRMPEAYAKIVGQMPTTQSATNK